MKETTETPTVAEKLYFGSVLEHYGSANGTCFKYESKQFEEANDDEQLRKISLLRLKPVEYLGKEYASLILPGIPAVDLKRNEGLIEKGRISAPNELPSVLNKVLIKQKDGPYIGIQSGIRSGILKIDGTWYRLKGCGNLYDRFPYRDVEYTDESGTKLKCQEIRGCMFEHTTARELHMFDKIHTLLKPFKIATANESLGWYEYETAQNHAKVKRCAAVYKCLGEKRLATHVLFGLEQLMPILYPSISRSDLLSLFPKTRMADEQNIYETFMLALIDTGDFGAPIDFATHKLTEKLDVVQVRKAFPKIKQEFQELLESSCKQFSATIEDAKTKAGLGNLLGYLYYRFGHEIGTIMRLLRANDISWGTYFDKLGIHCNAHSNNLVLVNESDGGGNTRPFLGLLDLDMAFTRGSFNQAQNKFDEWMVMEDKGMKMVLGGDPELNSGVKMDLGDVAPEYSLLKSCLRDTMIRGYDDGYKDTKNEHPQNPALAALSHHLLKIALMITSEEIA
eukprot:TRINITY_DN18214_c0_g1_i1.p1 TRINITY_DN18214_c0_g1~~TRINITY_DN18214_c0_g1_i1.p1  ORF type:complete len:508 (+),score=85.94 TRINITY_DN18214_c0_g1_i1:3-1526(+)